MRKKQQMDEPIVAIILQICEHKKVIYGMVQQTVQKKCYVEANL